jgi:pimeloyl-ACP methyl ester carboxylesterase
MLRITVSPLALLLALCTQPVACEESNARLEDSPLMRGWMDHVQSLPAHLEKDVLAEQRSESDRYNFTMHWFDQRLDHINKLQHGRWWQRYFVYDKYSRLEKNYPLFVFCGAEQGDIYKEWERLGFMLKVARAHGAKVMWLEHRFFGASMPFQGAEAFAKRPDRVGLLSLEQSLADYAAIVRKHRGDGPVLTFGGSLSGTIAAMMRIQYPTLIDMAFASSAPILGVDGVADPFAWRARLTANFAELGGPGCPDAVRKGFSAMQSAASNPHGNSSHRLWKAIRPCEAEPISAARWQAVTSMAWARLEALGNFAYPPSKSGIPDACKRMEAAGSGEEVFAALLGFGASAPTPGGCLNFTRMETSTPESNYGVGHGWSYMACTEVIHPIGANNKTDMFPPYDWTVEALSAGCMSGWSVMPDASYLQRKFGVHVDGHGLKAQVRRSKNLPGRILFTYGDYDPWGTMVPKDGWADDVEIIRVPEGAHCSDLETARPEDTDGMKEARRKIAAVLSEWIADVQKMRVMKVNNFGEAMQHSESVQPFGGKTLRGGKAAAKASRAPKISPAE